ncbi:hypothetical protein EGW08_008653 [Elysia chlorotica]|uniref:THAP-type domain-containing protein n=1 Tax=Elysia chlorotica TaxID=188477 RepID=A0A3S1A5Z1_ELYCH|nr:hypothetical protein EGW08_008653 [Elysia chlorotica]
MHLSLVGGGEDEEITELNTRVMAVNIVLTPTFEQAGGKRGDQNLVRTRNLLIRIRRLYLVRQLSWKLKPFTLTVAAARLYRCKVWIQNSRRQDLMGLSADVIRKKRVVFCSEHFEENQFNCPLELSSSSRRTLKWNAVPTLFDIPNPPPKATPKRKHTIRAAPEVPSKKTKSNISQASQGI